MDDLPKGRPLAIDAAAKSASLTDPAFIAPPEGATVYYGFVVLDDVTVDGFTLSKITDFEAETCEGWRCIRDCARQWYAVLQPTLRCSLSQSCPGWERLKGQGQHPRLAAQAGVLQ